MSRNPTIPKAQWSEAMEMQFCQDYVEWKKSGKWDPNDSSDANWMWFASHLNCVFGKDYAWSVYHSKLQRLKKTRRAYTKLKGYRVTPETGMGWNEEMKCFLVDNSQWNNLILENKEYAHFRFRQPTQKYKLLSKVFEGETATGSRAQASTVSLAEVIRQQRKHASAGRIVDLDADDDLGQPSDPSPVLGGLKLAGKRPASSQGVTSSYAASRGLKSSRSSENNPCVNCATSLSNLANLKLKLAETRNAEYEQYDVTIATAMVATFKDTVPPGKRITVLKALQEIEWRKTFFTMERELQEFWLQSLAPAKAYAPTSDSGDEQ